jgi:hypothetical protein
MHFKSGKEELYMIINENIVHSNDCHCFSWKPIVAGALVAIGLTFLLNLFSVAIGLTAFSTTSDGVETLVFGGLLATAIGIIASMFAAGWLTGYLSQRHCVQRHLGALYGFLAWCLALIITIFLAGHVQQYISFYGHFLSGTTDMVVHAASPEKAVATVQGDIHTKTLAISTYIIFSLFFLSAFACSLGGHCGARHVCKSDTSC